MSTFWKSHSIRTFKLFEDSEDPKSDPLKTGNIKKPDKNVWFSNGQMPSYFTIRNQDYLITDLFWTI